MKKSLIALAVLAASGAAMAQSSVTLFGIVDANFAYGSGSIYNKTSLKNSGYNSSRLGFRGVEDLGGGLSASFWLEGALSNDDGTPGGLTFQRRSTVSLNGGFGEVRLGRDYTPQFWNLAVFDPFGTNGVGTTQTLNGVSMNPATNGVAYSLQRPVVRQSNSIGYFLPGKLGGFYGQVQFGLGEQASNLGPDKKNGNELAARLGYANGPINVALAFSDTKGTANSSIKTWNLGGQYDLGVAKIMSHYAADNPSGADNDGKGFLIGALVPVGAGEVRLAYSTYKIDTVGADPRSSKLALGYVHNLSKRTALYATYAHVSNKNAANSALNDASTAAGRNSNGYDLGIRHSF